MTHRIEVGTREGRNDPKAKGIANFARSIGIPVDDVRRIKAYTIDKDIGPDSLDMLAQELFADPIVELASVDTPMASAHKFDYLVEVGFKPGVMDTVGNTAAEAIGDMLDARFGKGEAVYTSMQVLVKGKGLTREQMDRLAAGYLANDNIQRWRISDYGEVAAGRHQFEAPRVRINRTPAVKYIGLDVDNERLMGISHERSLALNLKEMQAIRSYFAREGVKEARRLVGLPEKPADAEMEIFGQKWSEHCDHKIFRGKTTYSETPESQPETIESLFDTYIRDSTEKLQAVLPWILSTLKDNAGVIRFNDRWLLALKAETHNSPSNVEPFGGAETGIVGVYRDPMGTGMGGRVIFGTYGFCTGHPSYNGNLRPRLHPKRLLEGVRSGVESGGNKSGVPTPFGLTYFDDGYMGKPAIFVGAASLIPAEVGGKPGYENEVKPGDLIVMAGGKVGIDGIHGATQSSMEAGDQITSGHVQIGDPYTQKNMMDFLVEARDLGLYRAITDNGAGGLSSSVGEMARKSGGFEMHLDRVPLKYDGLDPWQILVSESQERMTLAVDPSKYGELERLAREHGVEISNLGEFNGSGKFHAFYGGKTVAYLDMDFVHDGFPQMELNAAWKSPEKRGLAEPVMDEPHDYNHMLLEMLRRPNIASKEYIARQYDHEVQGTSVVKPLVGEDSDTFSDAAVLRPDLESHEGIAITAALNPAYGEIDTYHMAAATIDEAIRRVVAVGGNPEEVALIDNFCWPSPLPGDNNPDAEYKMAQLVRANKALHEYTLAFKAPCISGKDSMSMDGEVADDAGVKHRVSAPPTLQMTAVAKLEDARKAVTMDAKLPGDKVYILGVTRDELGGSEYYAMRGGQKGLNAPKVDAASSSRLYKSLHAAMAEGLVSSARGCYRGGLAVALAQTAFAGGYAMDVELSMVPLELPMGPNEFQWRDDKILFSESAGRFVVTVSPKNEGRFEEVMRGNDYEMIGHVSGGYNLRICGIDGENIIDAPLSRLKSSWQRPFGV
ncbi:MAG: phosphoribosylformylglycinamidine synthase [Candidatus Aenigmarchaeota archaeon]|nr:phosphoribosylformylglycinamidine synthase [Candidatus Aenigmarchaeota archaeon]